MRLIIIRKPDYTRGYIIDGTFYWLSPPEDHPLGEVVSTRHERRRQEAKPAMQPMLRTADDQDEGHMIVGSGVAVPDDYLALGLLGRKPHFCVGGVLYRGGPSAIRDTMAFCGRGNAGQMVDGHFVGQVWPNCSTSPAITGQPGPTR
jgi:hypothetical protein